MSDDVIDLEDERLARTPHMTFEVRCVACGHQWQAVVPVPVPHHMECSKCEWPARKALNADVIALLLSEEGVEGASYLAVKIAETFDQGPFRAQRLEAALQEIATGEIIGEPRNYRDALAICRDIARSALTVSNINDAINWDVA
jgi:hypothetical protein